MAAAPSGPSFFETVNMYFDKAAALTDYPEGLLDQIKVQLRLRHPVPDPAQRRLRGHSAWRAAQPPPRARQGRHPRAPTVDEDEIKAPRRS